LQIALTELHLILRLTAQAVVAHRSALEVFTREQSPQQWAAAQLDLGAALVTQSRQSEGAN
jgi:hypothetical protein